MPLISDFPALPGIYQLLFLHIEPSTSSHHATYPPGLTKPHTSLNSPARTDGMAVSRRGVVSPRAHPGRVPRPCRTRSAHDNGHLATRKL